MAQKMHTYDEMSTTKSHPWVPQESEEYVLRSPNVERDNHKNFIPKYLINALTECP